MGLSHGLSGAWQECVSSLCVYISKCVCVCVTELMCVFVSLKDRSWRIKVSRLCSLQRDDLMSRLWMCVCVCACVCVWIWCEGGVCGGVLGDTWHLLTNLQESEGFEFSLGEEKAALSSPPSPVQWINYCLSTAGNSRQPHTTLPRIYCTVWSRCTHTASCLLYMLIRFMKMIHLAVQLQTFCLTLETSFSSITCSCFFTQTVISPLGVFVCVCVNMLRNLNKICFPTIWSGKCWDWCGKSNHNKSQEEVLPHISNCHCNIKITHWARTTAQTSCYEQTKHNVQ